MAAVQKVLRTLVRLFRFLKVKVLIVPEAHLIPLIERKPHLALQIVIEMRTGVQNLTFTRSHQLNHNAGDFVEVLWLSLLGLGKVPIGGLEAKSQGVLLERVLDLVLSGLVDFLLLAWILGPFLSLVLLLGASLYFNQIDQV